MWVTILGILEGIGWLALGCFTLHCLWLLGLWFEYHRRPPEPPRRFAALPQVTVQLPVFNERYVVERLLEAVARLDYPRDRLEIQVLDDSTDDTTELIAARVARLQAGGFRVQHLHRAHRSGFKAGALSEGLAQARGEFLALFDADFVPGPDFLQQTIHYFTDPAVGMVQTRWGHLNRCESILTRAQALMLDGHFLIEQVTRSRGGAFFNFNGSAGVWRRCAIEDAGGWHADTLAEDLDLSYRVQLRGWRFLYLSDVVVPAELPAEMGSLKSQHHRWAKGSIQAAKKLLPQVLRSSRPWHVKLEACFHFGNWLHYPLGILVALLVLPQLVINRNASGGGIGGVISLCLVGTTVLFHAVAQRRAGTPWAQFLLELPLLMVVSVGLALNNTRAIWEALRGTPSEFHRTPKYDRQAVGRPESYRSRGRVTGWWGTAELALGLYVCVALAYAASQALYSVVPFLLPVSAGFLYAGLSSFAPANPLRSNLVSSPIAQPVGRFVKPTLRLGPRPPSTPLGTGWPGASSLAGARDPERPATRRWRGAEGLRMSPPPSRRGVLSEPFDSAPPRSGQVLSLSKDERSESPPRADPPLAEKNDGVEPRACPGGSTQQPG